MFLIRCTAKLRKEMGLGETSLYADHAPASPMATWYANLLRISRRKCVLFTHAESLFSFVTFDAGKARLKNLAMVFREGLRKAMESEGFTETVILKLLEQYEGVSYAKTDSRSILGSMNDLAENFRCYTLAGGGMDYFDLPTANLKLNHNPIATLGYRYPIEKFSGMLGVDSKELLENRITANTGSGAVYQLKVILRYSEPAIWRRILVRDVTLDKLSDLLIATMGWMDVHLHIFTIGGKRYSIPDPEWYDPEIIDESTVKLSDVASVKDLSFIYEYDLGDSWQHEVLIETIGHPEPGKRYPACIDGANKCPPEDVGGIGGFYEFLGAAVNPAHPEHQRMLAWAGGSFDPTAFDVEQTNNAMIASLMELGWRDHP